MALLDVKLRVIHLKGKCRPIVQHRFSNLVRLKGSCNNGSPDPVRQDRVFKDPLLNLFSSKHTLDVMARYHLQAGGKGLRGKVAYAESRRLAVDESRSLQWGLVCELLHNATLIHDDIQDNDPIRRGQPSLWKKYGVNQAINAGDYLIFRAFKIASRLNSSQLIYDLAETSELLVKGQSDETNQQPLQVENCWNFYLEMTRLKTGALFLLPITGAHLLAERELEDSTRKAWLDLGVCYQIYDDIRDFLGLKQAGQKKQDLMEKKVNGLIAKLSTQPTHRNLMRSYLNTNADTAEFLSIINEISQLVEKENILSQLENEAKDFLKNFTENTHKETRQIIFDYMESATQFKGDRNVR